MKEIELLTDLIHLLDKYDPETCASLARELSNPDFIPRLLDLLRILGNRPMAQSRETDYPTTETVQRARFTRHQARHLEEKIYGRPKTEQPRHFPVEPRAEPYPSFVERFLGLKDLESKGDSSDFEDLPEDEQIIK